MNKKERSSLKKTKKGGEEQMSVLKSLFLICLGDDGDDGVIGSDHSEDSGPDSPDVDYGQDPE